MNLGRINLITPPDKLYNSNPTYFLIKPSTKIKMQFQTLLSQIDDELNVYVYDDNETDIDWMLSVAQMSDFVIIDVDNCDPMTKLFVSVLLTQPNAYYLTTDEITPYKLLNRNRIYNLDWINEILNDTGDEEEDEQ
jgi:hypothetical protein